MNLNNIQEIKKNDPGKVLDSMSALPDQCKQAWEDASLLSLPDFYRDVENIVFAGMGGSNLGQRLVQAVYKTSFSKPIEIVNHYQLPGYADKKTLVIASSYSGNTEETIEVANQALGKECKVLAITAGGKLMEMAEQHGFSVYKFDPKYNPSGQPRLGIGYSIFAQLALFNKLNFIKVSQDEIDQVIADLSSTLKHCNTETLTFANRAKSLAINLQNKIPIWIGSEHLVGNTRIANNQVNETAKAYSGFYTLPELNHHLMEGLKNPFFNKNNLVFVAFKSDRYIERNQKRFEITKSVVEKNNIAWHEFIPRSKTNLSQAMEVLFFSSFVSFYLSMLYGENPQLIPWVDYFKKELDARC